MNEKILHVEDPRIEEISVYMSTGPTRDLLILGRSNHIIARLTLEELAALGRMLLDVSEGSNA